MTVKIIVTVDPPDPADEEQLYQQAKDFVGQLTNVIDAAFRGLTIDGSLIEEGA